MAVVARRGVLGVGLGLTVLLGCADLDPALMQAVLGRLGGPDERQVAAGLREALQVGTRRAATEVSRTDGYWGDARIRIPLPEEVEPMARALRSVGFGRKVDTFQLTMNRAAESAASEAVDVFLGAIARMTLSDALGILNGGQTAATDYFREATGGQLIARFSPVVERKMQEVGLYRIYREIEASYDALPFTPEISFDLGQHVTTRAVDGLFVVLAQEETRIREDPAARTTELLREVFGR